MSKQYYADNRIQSSDLIPVSDPSVGENLYINSYKSFGIVRYVGTTDFAIGTWVGLELTSPIGKNDGTVKGKRYFPCQPQHGIFVRMTACSRVKEDDLDDSGDYSAGNTPPLRALGRNSVIGRDSMISSVKPGGFKTPSKAIPIDLGPDSPPSPRLSRPFVSRATRESLLGSSKDNIKKPATIRESSRMSTSAIASRSANIANSIYSKPAPSPALSRASTSFVGRSRISAVGGAAATTTPNSSRARSSSRLSTVRPVSDNSAESTIDELKNRVIVLEDTMKKFSDIILDGVQAIIFNHSAVPNAELTVEEVETLKRSLLAVSDIAQQAHDAVLQERKKHTEEIEKLKRELQVSS